MIIFQDVSERSGRTHLSLETSEFKQSKVEGLQ